LDDKVMFFSSGCCLSDRKVVYFLAVSVHCTRQTILTSFGGSSKRWTMQDLSEWSSFSIHFERWVVSFLQSLHLDILPPSFSDYCNISKTKLYLLILVSCPRWQSPFTNICSNDDN
jgi:hypothetical protein